MQLSNAFFLCYFSSQVRLPDYDNYEGYHAEIVGLFRATPHRATGEPVIDLAHPLKWLDCFNKQRHTEGVNIQYVPLDKIEGAIALGPLWNNMVNDAASRTRGRRPRIAANRASQNEPLVCHAN